MWSLFISNFKFLLLVWPNSFKVSYSEACQRFASTIIWRQLYNCGIRFATSRALSTTRIVWLKIRFCEGCHFICSLRKNVYFFVIINNCYLKDYKMWTKNVCMVLRVAFKKQQNNFVSFLPPNSKFFSFTLTSTIILPSKMYYREISFGDLYNIT